MWDKMYDLYLQNGTEILINLGGAGGGLEEMFRKNYKTNLMILKDLFDHFFFIKGVVIDAENYVSLKDINNLVEDLKLMDMKVYFAPIYTSLLYPNSPGMGGFSYNNFEDSQETVDGFFVQAYSSGEFTGSSFKEVNINFMNFETLTFGILPGTVSSSQIKDRIKSLGENGCKEVYIWELGENGAVDLIREI